MQIFTFDPFSGMITRETNAAGGYIVAQVDYSRHEGSPHLRQDIAESNGYLLAAAPELLAALEVFANAFDGDLENVGGGTSVCPQFKAQDFKNAKAAIAKAKGEQS